MIASCGISSPQQTCRDQQLDPYPAKEGGEEARATHSAHSYVTLNYVLVKAQI